MCYKVTQAKKLVEYVKFYVAPTIQEQYEKEAFFQANGFAHPQLLTITSKDGVRQSEMMQWGLIPNWKRPYADMLKHSNNTLNAKSETIFDLASFKGSINKFRCILPVEGFFEYKHVEKDKLPFFIHPKENPFFNLAGIYSFYKNPLNDEWIKSFSIVTGEANELMASIHNSGKRMPLIIDNENIDRWLDPNISKEEINHLMIPCDDTKMNAYRVNRDLIKMGNTSEAFAPIPPNTLF